jgi:hypothetical protein
MAVSLGLSILPAVVLVIGLMRAGCLGEALLALRGSYLSHGVPDNPWVEFVPYFGLPLAAFIGLSWALSVVLRCSWPVPLRLAIGVLVVSLASVAYGWSMVLASLAYLWFQDLLVIGDIGSPVLFWASMFISFVSLGLSHYGLALTSRTL